MSWMCRKDAVLHLVLMFCDLQMENWRLVLENGSLSAIQVLNVAYPYLCVSV